AVGDQRFRFPEQCCQRYHHAIADEAADTVAKDAGGNEVKHGLLAADHKRVPGVVPALEAHHGGCPVGQQIDDFALALIAPLRADDDDVISHLRFLDRYALTMNRRSRPDAIAMKPIVRRLLSLSLEICSTARRNRSEPMNGIMPAMIKYSAEAVSISCHMRHSGSHPRLLRDARWSA